MRSRIQAMGGLAALMGATIVVCGGGASTAAGATVNTRYASPTGTESATCPKSEPCDLASAINAAPASSDVIVLPGTYIENTTLIDNNSDLLIVGQGTATQPVIVSSTASPAGFDISNGSRVTGLSIAYNGAGQGLYVSKGSADHVRVISTGSGSHSCTVNTMLTDSLCVDSSPGGSALSAVDNSASPTYKNVTAIATGPNSRGLNVDGDAGSTNVTATSSIFSGTADDVAFMPEDDGETETVTLHNCDFATTFFNNLGAGVSTESITVDNTDTKALPRFVDAFDGNFHERAGSPTINTGAAVTGPDKDLSGVPRTLGGAPDMGAYEFEQDASVSGLTLSKKKPKSIEVAASVNPEGLATTVHSVAIRGHVTITSKTVLAGAGLSATKLKFGLTGLNKNAKYSIRVIAVNSAGTTTSAAKKLTTPKK